MSEINLSSLQAVDKISNNTVISLSKKIGTVFAYRSLICSLEQSDGETFDNGMFFSVQKYRRKIAYEIEGIRQNLVKLNRCAALLGVPLVLENVDTMSRTGIYNAIYRHYKSVNRADDIELWVDNIEPQK